MAEGDIAVVIGGAGFLGQHIVRLLQERTMVKEIRVFDITGYRNNMGHKERVLVTSIVGDLRKLSDLEEAFRGADVVYHTASLVCVAAFPDYDLMEEINVKGTSNVISACVSRNVSRLVYTSTIDVAVGKTWRDIDEEAESEPYPQTPIYRGYAGTKCRAEQMVLAANGKQLFRENGFLRTASIRPSAIYGEQDVNFVTKFLKTAKQLGGTFITFGQMGVQPIAYVGNTAWGHVVASQVLQRDPKVGGEAFAIIDGSPKVSFQEFCKTFLKLREFNVSRYDVPFWLMYLAVCLLQLVCLLFQPLWRVGPSVLTRSSLIHLRKNITFSGKKAHDILGYRPLYSFNESMQNSIGFYKQVPL